MNNIKQKAKNTKLNMDGFDYNHGSSTIFTGKFGKVELKYFKGEINIFDKTEKVEEPHFIAYLFNDNDIVIQIATSNSSHVAVSRLYQEYARSCAMEDLGIFDR